MQTLLSQMLVAVLDPLLAPAICIVGVWARRYIAVIGGAALIAAIYLIITAVISSDVAQFMHNEAVYTTFPAILADCSIVYGARVLVATLLGTYRSRRDGRE